MAYNSEAEHMKPQGKKLWPLINIPHQNIIQV